MKTQADERTNRVSSRKIGEPMALLAAAILQQAWNDKRKAGKDLSPFAQSAWCEVLCYLAGADHYAYAERLGYRIRN